MEVDLKREELIESEIRGFLEGNNECITLLYQPQLNIKTDKVIGVEALARMNSKHFGQVSPLEFIPIAERTNLIIPLGLKLFELAAKFVKKMENLGIEIKTAINISGIQVLDDEFSDTIFNIINKNNINPKNIELEITESILLDNFNLINNRLKEFKDKNIDVALDDFGTGYSSFFRLRELNVNSLKIDKSFIENINNKDKKELITGEIITMAHKFELKVIAEGVENKEELNYLKENDCDIIQGYIFSKAIKEDEVIRFVSRHNGV
jgi:EAL domain-containing protein (putative c-di-GMP-specific phosphodiesterase class I)